MATAVGRTSNNRFLTESKSRTKNLLTLCQNPAVCPGLIRADGAVRHSFDGPNEDYFALYIR